MNPFLLWDFSIPSDLLSINNNLRHDRESITRNNNDPISGGNDSLLPSHEFSLLMNEKQDCLSRNQEEQINERHSPCTTQVELNEYASVACNTCRANHRRCDRLKPSCYSCKSRGISCTYDANIKRKARNRPNNQEIKEEDLVILDCFFQVSGYHIITRQEVEQFLLVSYRMNDSNLTQEQKEMYALYYSIKAISECQMGMIDRSEISAKQAKEYLSKVFDSHSSLKVAESYLNMCMYEVWFERLLTAKFYFQILLFYRNSPDNNVHWKQLNISIMYLEAAVFNTDDRKNLHQMNFERFIMTVPEIFCYFMDCPNKESETHSEDQYLSSQYYLLKHPHLIDSSNCIEVNTFIQTIFKYCKRYEDTKYGKYPGSDLYYEFVESGVTIALLSKSSNRTSMIEYVIETHANSIVNSIQNPRFELCPLEVLLHISFATEYHFSLVEKGIYSRNSVNYIEMLQIELNAYQFLQSRYKIAKYYFYGGIFKKLDDYFNTSK